LAPDCKGNPYPDGPFTGLLPDPVGDHNRGRLGLGRVVLLLVDDSFGRRTGRDEDPGQSA